MGSFGVRATVKLTGPLADGSAPQIVHTWLDGVKQDIAGEGVRMLRAVKMDKTGRATGHYQAELQATTVSYNDVKLHSAAIYGPWLEGVSERNRSTRFKGYHLWRQTAQELDRLAPQIAEKRMPELVRELGGGS